LILSKTNKATKVSQHNFKSNQIRKLWNNISSCANSNEKIWF